MLHFVSQPERLRTTYPRLWPLKTVTSSVSFHEQLDQRRASNLGVLDNVGTGVLGHVVTALNTTDNIASDLDVVVLHKEEN